MAITDYYHSISIRTITETVDTVGGVVTSYVDTVVTGLITQASAAMLEIANKKQIDITHTLYCDVSLYFNYVDRIVDNVTSESFQVSGEPLNTVKRDHHLRVPLKRVDNLG